MKRILTKWNDRNLKPVFSVLPDGGLAAGLCVDDGKRIFVLASLAACPHLPETVPWVHRAGDVQE